MELNEMAMSRRDAINKCLDLSKPFIEHFHRLFNDTNEDTRNHHLSEMQNWYDQVSKIKLTKTNKYLNEKNLYDWFFTGCQLMSDWFENEDGDEISRYEVFVDLILDDGLNIYDAWEESKYFSDINHIREYYD